MEFKKPEVRPVSLWRPLPNQFPLPEGPPFIEIIAIHEHAACGAMRETHLTATGCQLSAMWVSSLCDSLSRYRPMSVGRWTVEANSLGADPFRER